jgi:hypothetical protein
MGLESEQGVGKTEGNAQANVVKGEAGIAEALEELDVTLCAFGEGMVTVDSGMAMGIGQGEGGEGEG